MKQKLRSFIAEAKNGPHVPDDFHLAHTVFKQLTKDREEAGAKLRAVPGVGSAAAGKTPDDVRARHDFRAAYDAHQRAMNVHHTYSKAFLKKHRKQFNALSVSERDARRAAKKQP